MKPVLQTPELKTERLRLRAHEMRDLDSFWAFYQSPRAVYMDRPQDRTQLWSGVASETGSWQLAGWGGWMVETRDGETIGQVAVTHPPHFAELELGWLMFDGFEGQGYAFEAATAARDFAFGAMGAETLVSYIHRDNARSIALAKRLGAVLDPAAACHDADDVVYRHPAPEQTDGGMEAYA